MFRNSLFSNGGFIAIQAIQSPDFLTGVRGWQIRKDGTVEFNSATVRGSLVVGTVGGARIIIDTGAFPFINFTTGNANETSKAAIYAQTANLGLPQEDFRLVIASPAANGTGTGKQAQYELTSEAEDSSHGALHIFRDAVGSTAVLTADVTNRRVTVDGIITGSKITGTQTVSFAALTSNTIPVTFPQAFTSVPAVMTNINSGSGTAAHWSSRAFNITTTGFTLFVYSEAGAAAQTWTNIPVQWMAIGT